MTDYKFDILGDVDPVAQEFSVGLGAIIGVEYSFGFKEYSALVKGQ